MPAVVSHGLCHALSIDVEEHFQVSGFEDVVSAPGWQPHASRVVDNNLRVLDTLAEAGDIKATFFVLGQVAERFPEVVKAIVAGGHELACHGWSHQRITHQDAATFAEETRRAKGVLEESSGVAVDGYRAATFSIVEQTRWAIDVLAEAGFTYDSSVVPTRHDRYGIPDAPLDPFLIDGPGGGQLAEFPITVLPLPGYRLPVAGGGYFRLYPYAFSRWAMRRVAAGGRRVVFYLHPWELDPDQPRIGGSAMSRFRHYNNLHRCQDRLRRLLGDFRFTTVRGVLQELTLLPAEPVAP